MFRFKNSVYFILLILLCSCGRFSEITVGEINGLTINGFEENALVMTLSVPIGNPTLHRITITDFDTRLYMNAQYIGKITSVDAIVLTPRSKMQHDLVLHVRMANFIGTAIGIMNLKKGQKVNFRLEGTVMARTRLMKKKIYINEIREVTI
jgi:LEA14-like dessication related protein